MLDGFNDLQRPSALDSRHVHAFSPLFFILMVNEMDTFSGSRIT